ncbi:hypothetical protein MRX96_048226 [Rhipicephalus microplus]
MAEGVHRGLVLRNEKANENYTTDFIYRLYCEEGKDVFTARQNILGHMQQGGTPSPFDRNFGTKTATRAFEWMVLQLKAAAKPDGTVHATTPETACLLGLIRRQYFFTPVQDLKSKTDWKHRLPKSTWWPDLRPMLNMLATSDRYLREMAGKHPLLVEQSISRGH